MLTGTVAGFLAIFLFLKDQGFGFALLYWAASAAAYTFICNWVLADGVRSIIGLVTFAIGSYFAFLAFF